MTDDSSSFARDVVARIRRLTTPGRLTFGELVWSLPGVDPIVVRDQLANGASELSARVHWTECSDVSVLDSRLPVPHPLDFDWRFTSSTLTTLADELCSQGSRITLLGAPSLWVVLAQDMRAKELHLLDSNPLVGGVHALWRAANCHLVDVLSDEIPNLAPADVILADPPWYPEAHEGFLWTAAKLVRPGGLVLVSVPPVGTRPGIHRERENLLQWTRSLGLSVRSKREGAVRYAMPPFERAALKAARLATYVPNDWRQGDVLVFERTGEGDAVRPVHRRKRWAERVVDGVRIRIDVDAAPSGADPRLVSLVEGDVLPSVSRRDARRASARVWTSGNRVFGCAAPELFLHVLEQLEDTSGSDLLASVPAAWVNDARAQIKRVVLLEREEYICSEDV